MRLKKLVFFSRYKNSAVNAAILLCISCILALLSLSLYFEISPSIVIKQAIRIAGVQVTSRIYKNELVDALKLEEKYFLGGTSDSTLTPKNSWKVLGRQHAYFSFGLYSGATQIWLEVPYIFEDYNAIYLEELRNRYQLEEKISTSDSEYEAMLSMAAWVGSRWDHGTDTPIGGQQNFKVTDVIVQGEAGHRFWCEVSARAMSQVASALGWPSRVISLSRNGYDWEHAVVELWSNQFEKWFVVDTDFNVVYEENSIPLSAYELVHEGEYLDNAGRLIVRQTTALKQFFVKRSGEIRELSELGDLSFYTYAHIDMRNDWHSRNLSKGSPVGGDLATYYTLNDTITSPFNSMRKVKNKAEFNWPVNFVELYLRNIKFSQNEAELGVDIKAYGPYVKNIEARIDSGEWVKVLPKLNKFNLNDGVHMIESRLVLINGYGPVTKVTFEIISRNGFKKTI